MTSTPETFMQNPLVIWAQTFQEARDLVYKDLIDGIFLNDVMCAIDPHSAVADKEVKDVKDRLKNWDVLMKNIQVYYQEVLQQLIVMRLPNVPTIVRESHSGDAQKELRKVLLLILGCAVQCERKEAFIQCIQQLQLDVQQAIVEHIQEITDNRKNVFAIELLEEDQVSEVTHVVFDHLRTVIAERDGYVEEIKNLGNSLEELYEQQNELQKRPPTPPSVSPEKHHMAVELAECKAKMRKLRQDLEEKSELAAELQEDLDEQKAQLTKLRNENLELVQEARSARTYRDELDIFKEKASRVDKYELEINKYREKLQELEFYKTRVEEIREDNAILVETKNVLEDQMNSLQKRVDGIVELENELLKAKNHTQELQLERERDQLKLTELVEENARLEYEKKSTFNESASLEEELVRARSQLHAGLNNSLSAQLNETSSAKVLRLELENQRLLQKLAELKREGAAESAGRSLELEKENHRLALKVEKLQLTASSESQAVLDVEGQVEEVRKEYDVLQNTLSAVRESAERQARELERENHQLSQQVAALRERTEKTENLRVQEVEAENTRLHGRIKELSAEVSQLDYELRSLQKDHAKLQSTAESQKDLEQYNARLQKQMDSLHKQVGQLQLTCDKYETLEAAASDVEVERDKLARQVDVLTEQVAKLDSLEQENINLSVEVQHLKRALEVAKNSGTRVGELEALSEQLQQELSTSKRRLESLTDNSAKQEQLEVNLLELDTENQRLQRNLEAASRRTDELQRDLASTEARNAQLQKNLDSLRLSLRRLEDLEKENKELENENTGITKYKSQIEKENKRLKQALESREAALDEVSATLSGLEKENKQLAKDSTKIKDLDQRVREYEKENTEFFQQAELDKKTLTTLREDLVNEKIKNQQLISELEKLTQELEKVGLNKEKLVAAQENENKYIALESLMEEALQRSMAIKEEKIHALESRLEASKSRNVSLQDELRQVKQEFEAMLQRREEEGLQMSSETARYRATSFPNATKDILELKDHLISVERKNAWLEAENQQLRSGASTVQTQLQSAESARLYLQEQLSSQQNLGQSLQAQLAQLQVENSTLSARAQGMHSQLATLQAQHDQLQQEQERLLAAHEELQLAQRSLSTDHDALQRLHEQLTGEYEALITEHGTLKASHKAAKGELRDLQEKTSDVLREKDTLNQIKRAIEEDRHCLKTEAKSMGTLQLELAGLREENIRLRATHDKLQMEYHDVNTEHKTTKNELNQLRLRHSELQRNFNECRDQLNALDIEVNKMASRCEALSQLNTKVEEENRTLMMQLQALLNQNQELLTTTLESRDHFHEEERGYMEKMAELRRQKEKLEEKIMEQYRRYDPVKKKNRGFGANLVRKARGLINKANRSRERPKTPVFGESPDSSVGDSSLGDHEHQGETSSFLRKKRNRRERRNSLGDMLDSPRLGQQKKSLAKSTTALHMLRDDKKEKANLRGARSTENLLSSQDTPRSSRHASDKDNDSLSSSSSSHPNSEWPTRPPRRRTLLDNSYASHRRQGSLSSEDTSLHKETGTTMKLVPRSNSPDNEGMISLLQFLEESNRSPASRRKLLLAKRIDPDEIHQDKAETTAPPPPSFLTPRAPTGLDDDDTDGLSPATRRRLLTSKSEACIAQLSRQNNKDPRLCESMVAPKSSSGSVYAPQPYSRDRSQSTHSLVRPDLPGQQARMNGRPDTQPGQSESRPHSRLEQRPLSRNEGEYRPSSRQDHAPRPPSRGGEYTMNDNPQETGSRPASRMELEHLHRTPSVRSSDMSPRSTESIPRSPSCHEYLHHPQSHSTPNQRSHSISDPANPIHSSTKGFRDTRSHSVVDNRTAMLPRATGYRENGSHDERPAPVGQANTSVSNHMNGRARNGSDSSLGSRFSGEPIYASLPRQSASSRPSTHNRDGKLKRSGSTTYGDYMSMDGHVMRNGNGEHGPTHLARSHSVAGEMVHHTNGNHQEDTENIAVNSVRSLVQNFQKNIQSDRPQVEPPVPPPRRTRPISAGPLHPENFGASTTNNFADTNGTGGHSMSSSLRNDRSGPTTPRGRPGPPSYTTINITMNSMCSTLHEDPAQQQRPVEKTMPPDMPPDNIPRPGSTPPRLVPGKEDKPKSAVWYEYGCV